jgi:hypothetical protein
LPLKRPFPTTNSALHSLHIRLTLECLTRQAREQNRWVGSLGLRSNESPHSTQTQAIPLLGFHGGLPSGWDRRPPQERQHGARLSLRTASTLPQSAQTRCLLHAPRFTRRRLGVLGAVLAASRPTSRTNTRLPSPSDKRLSTTDFDSRQCQKLQVCGRIMRPRRRRLRKMSIPIGLVRLPYPADGPDRDPAAAGNLGMDHACGI